jgi:hypothetical protein
MFIPLIPGSPGHSLMGSRTVNTWKLSATCSGQASLSTNHSKKHIESVRGAWDQESRACLQGLEDTHSKLLGVRHSHQAHPHYDSTLDTRGCEQGSSWTPLGLLPSRSWSPASWHLCSASLHISASYVNPEGEA